MGVIHYTSGGLFVSVYDLEPRCISLFSKMFPCKTCLLILWKNQFCVAKIFQLKKKKKKEVENNMQNLRHEIKPINYNFYILYFGPNKQTKFNPTNLMNVCHFHPKNCTATPLAQEKHLKPLQSRNTAIPTFSCFSLLKVIKLPATLVVQVQVQSPPFQ